MRTFLAIAALGFVALATGCEKSGSESNTEAPKASEDKPSDEPGAGRPAQEQPAPEEATETAEVTPVEATDKVPDSAPKTGVAECDELIAIYVNCDKLPAQSREAFLRGAETWKQSIETGGDAAREALATACKQASDGARQALKAVGCAQLGAEKSPPQKTEPVDRDDLKIGVKSCDALIATYMACDKLPSQSRDAFQNGVKTWKKTVETGGDAARNALDQACKQAAEASSQALKAVGCAPVKLD